jgi:hypothetical protein
MATGELGAAIRSRMVSTAASSSVSRNSERCEAALRCSASLSIS